MAFWNEDGQLDGMLGVYAAGCAACFGISHIGAIHNGLLRWVPRVYSKLNVVLPVGRALFLLAFLQRGAENQERNSNARSDGET